jgi:Fic family protein
VPDNYIPPFTMTDEITNLVIEIAELTGAMTVSEQLSKNPKLRRDNRIKSIHSSLAIEQNTLTEEQVSDVIDGKRVLGPPQDIREVQNAYEAYEIMSKLNPHSVKDLLKAHKIMMEGLVKEAGVFRSKGVGVYAGDQLIHAGTPANYVPDLVGQLFEWLKKSKLHPLIKGCIFHYEFEFIHPFADGNGRTGRLWHTLILAKWQEFFLWIPIETIIHELYHTDQIISYTMLDMYGNDDASYRAAMESATEIQTLLYIANNLPEIQSKFKIKVDMSDDYVNSNLAVYEQFRFPYHRRRFEDHLFMLIDACVRDSKENRIKILNTIRYCICYKKSITVTINGDTLPVQIAPASPTEKPYIAPISTVNDFFYDHIFKYDHNVGVNRLISRDAESGNLTVNIDIDKSYYDIVLY